MKDQRLNVGDIVSNIDNAILGKLNIPEFQRKFVWTPEKVKKFVESLWREYPIGIVLLWESAYNSPRSAMGGDDQKLWIVDGQQRITSLALMFGKKPYWWEDASNWNETLAKYDVLVNISLDKDRLEFGLPNPVRKNSPEWVSVRKVLNEDNLSQLAQSICEKIPSTDFSSIHEKLDSVRRIRDFPIFEIIINHELEDVAEIFSRLNTAGTKIRESDIIIALVASKQKGWVREELDPYLRDLEEKGHDLDPGILIRSLGIMISGDKEPGGKMTARLRDIPQNSWEDSVNFKESWKKTKDAVAFVIRDFACIGVLSADLLPAHNVLIPMFVLRAKFQDNFNFKKALHWFLVATRDGRYSGSTISELDHDIRSIDSSTSFDAAIEALLSPLRVPHEFSEEDFRKDYGDEFMRMMLYLTIFDRKAHDWINQDIRIGYDRSDNLLNEGFKPEWHHFFPKKILKEEGVDETKMNALANIVVLNERANRRFTSKKPSEYLHEYRVSEERLIEQLVPTFGELWEVSNFDKFLVERARKLADSANAFMRNLRAGAT